jgi:hypothetical protein
MKRALYGLMLIPLLAAGCVDAPFTWPDKAATSAEQPAPKRVTAVRADQVTQENAREKAQELEDELENDRESPR